MRNRLSKPHLQPDTSGAALNVRGLRVTCALISAPAARAFSLLELLVVIAVAVLLTALTMPAMRQVHENAQRIVCMSHQQQLGHAFFMYGGDHNDALPPSQALNNHETPQNLMMSRRGVGQGPAAGWDGLGRLFEWHYCSAAECFYCPSHPGKHPYERYAGMWANPLVSGPTIFTNYHYAGHMEWHSGRKRVLTDGYDLVLATDGLRTAGDFNHVFGMNVLRGDGSVRWREDTDKIYQVLPKDELEELRPEYINLWDLVSER